MEFLSGIPLFGTFANAALIACGGLLGLALKSKLPKKIMELPVQGMALFVATIGIAMSIKTAHPLVVISSIALGSAMGELIGIESFVERGSKALEEKCGAMARGFSSGFVTASLIFCTGSLAVLGSFEEGLGGYPNMLLAKGLIDGLTAIALAASLGFGVIFSAIPIILYQGSLTLAAGWIQPFMTEAAVVEMSATGGLMLMAIAVNLLGLMKIRVMNMLPGFVLAVIFARIFL